MLTVEKLSEFGANTNEALERCMNNEQFYIMLVEKALKDDSLERLDAALKNGNLDEGFEIAHSLKGVLGNLSLTPSFKVRILMPLPKANPIHSDGVLFLCRGVRMRNELRFHRRKPHEIGKKCQWHF